MISAIRKDNIGFSSTIKFKDAKTIEEALKRGINVSPKLDLNSSQLLCDIVSPEFDVFEIKRGNQIGTSAILMCNAGGVVGGNTKNNLVFHLEPDLFFENFTQNLRVLNTKFKRISQLLKSEGRKLQGLIFGGDADFSNSGDLMIVIDNCMQKAGIKPTIFWGTSNDRRYIGYTKGVFYDGKNDTWQVNAHSIYTNGVDRKKEVLDLFNYVRIAPHDNVEFSDAGRISGEDGSLNKGTLGQTYEEVLEKYKVKGD